MLHVYLTPPKSPFVFIRHGGVTWRSMRSRRKANGGRRGVPKAGADHFMGDSYLAV